MATATTTMEVAPLEDSNVAKSDVDLQQTQARTSSQFVDSLEIESTQQDEPEYPTGAKFWLTYLAICMVLVLGGLDANIVATAVPSITDHFDTVADVGWYSSAFRLCSCALQFAFAKIYTLFPSKPVFLTSNAIFLLGSLLCAAATSSPMFVAGRAINGIAFAGQLSGCFAVLVEILPLQKRPAFAGSGACVESLAIIAAPIVGGALTQSLGWRWCFWINLPLGAVSLAVIFFFFPASPARPAHQLGLKEKLKQLDLVSTGLCIPSLTALFLALSWAGTKYPWSDARVIVLFVVFGVLLAAFLFHQHRRGDRAVLPFRILKNRNVIAGFIFTTFTNSMTNVLEYYLPTYYQVVRSRTPSASGYLMIPILFGMMLGLFLQGIGTSTLGYYKPFMILGSICMPIAAGLMTTFTLHTNLTKIILVSGFVGFGGGIGFQGSMAAVQTTLSPEDVNLGTGVILFGQNIGPAVFIAVAHVILTNRLQSSLEGIIPGLSPEFLENNGLGNLKNGVPMDQWNELFARISDSLTTTWYLPVALGCSTIVGSLLVEMRSVKQKKS